MDRAGQSNLTLPVYIHSTIQGDNRQNIRNAAVSDDVFTDANDKVEVEPPDLGSIFVKVLTFVVFGQRSTPQSGKRLLLGVDPLQYTSQKWRVSTYASCIPR